MLRFLTAARIAGAVIVLAATFLFGFWLTAPPFPVGRIFVAVSLNGEPIISERPEEKLLLLEVRRSYPPSLFRRAIGNGPCNGFDAEFLFLPFNFLIWQRIYRTALFCRDELEVRYFHALLGATRWRIEGSVLILTNGTDTLRFFLLAPT